MLEPKTLYMASIAMIAMMTLLSFLTWRANKQTPGTLLYIFYPMVLVCAVTGFAIHTHFQFWDTIPIANTLLFAASIVHCLAICQFLDHRGKAFSIFLGITGVLFIILTYYSVVTPHLRMRILISDLQHIAEALFLLYYFIRYALPIYPNGSIVYIIVLGLITIVSAGRSMMMGDVDHLSLFKEEWFAITIFFNGVLAPIFYATGMALLCNEQREQNLKRKTKEAEQSLELRSMFLSTISHEIRTPLNGILGSAQVILNRIQDARSKAYCEAIINSAGSLNLLIESVLNYAKVEQGNEALYEEDVELKSWLHNLCLLLSPLAEQKKLKFELIYELPEKACYYCDQEKLRQILVNLVGNAIKFTDTGEVKLKVELLDDAQIDHLLRFSVIDTGPGIAHSDIATLTEPYVQSSAGKSKGGTGLGLAITSRLLHRLDSELSISSQVNVGSQFSFDVNLVVGELSLVEQPSIHQDTLTGLNILLVEDLELNQKITIEFMAADAHKVKLATHGKEAIELIQSQKFDVVLLDMNLPDLTGQEIMRQLSTQDHMNTHTPFLAFTASLSPDEVKEYLSLGIKDIVGKPIKQDELRRKLNKSQIIQAPKITVDLADVHYDESAIKTLKTSFEEEQITSIYNEFVLSARNKLLNIQQHLNNDKKQCIQQLHRQASTALQLGFNRYGMMLKSIERRLLDDKPCSEEVVQAMTLWQESLSAYLAFVRKNTPL